MCFAISNKVCRHLPADLDMMVMLQSHTPDRMKMSLEDVFCMSFGSGDQRSSRAVQLRSGIGCQVALEILLCSRQHDIRAVQDSTRPRGILRQLPVHVRVTMLNWPASMQCSGPFENFSAGLGPGLRGLSPRGSLALP